MKWIVVKLAAGALWRRNRVVFMAQISGIWCAIQAYSWPEFGLLPAGVAIASMWLLRGWRREERDVVMACATLLGLNELTIGPGGTANKPQKTCNYDNHADDCQCDGMWGR